MNTTNRDANGQYDVKLERPCTCGHNMGQHTAKAAMVDGKKYRPCCELGCECECFKRAK